jgi:hypothetical protein
VVGPYGDLGAALWEAGVVTIIPVDQPLAINDRGHVLARRGEWVGIWDGATFTPHDNQFNVSVDWPMALNNHDEFVGTRDELPGDFPYYPFVAQGHQYTKLRDAGRAVDINDHGDIIGVHYQVRWSRVGPETFFTLGSPLGKIWSRGRCAGACCGDDADQR